MELYVQAPQRKKKDGYEDVSIAHSEINSQSIFTIPSDQFYQISFSLNYKKKKEGGI